ncbi:MAG: IS1634 family transposase [Anaerolineaceae bacterium]|nr:IS1634 family transposase [Anaerolineaceae bacterium]
MRLHITRSVNAECFYIVESIRKNGRNTSRVVEKLGNLEQVRLKAGEQDPYEWAREYAARLTREEKEQTRTILIPLNQAAKIPKGEIQRFNGGYLFLQKIYSELRIKDICKAISRRRDFDYDLNSILSRLIYCRVINPLSKMATFEYSQKLLEPPRFDLHQIYRALDVIAEESDYIQERLYLNSKAVIDRNTDILYYDCTNYFFEIEQEEGLKQYGACKENRPLPIVEMGLLMDGNGIPLAFCIHEGNRNEQTTLKPLEEKILEDFGLSKFIVCTDAGLSSANNKFFNSRKNRDFITATSVKKLPQERRERLMQPTGWKLIGDDGKKTYNLAEIDADENVKEHYYDRTFYKEEWFIDEVEIYDEDLQKTVKRNLSQRLILTFSFKYRAYLQAIRDRRIERAKKLIKQGEKAVNRRGRNDVREFIQEVAYTGTGEVADNKIYALNESAVAESASFDGYYAVYTSLDTKKYPVSKVNDLNHGRWEIEECFRIMKSEFLARPVYLKRDDRIQAHFLTCFIALLILRILEHKIDHKFSYPEIIDCLSEMDFTKIKDVGYTPSYTRTNLTDCLHEVFGFRTDYEIMTQEAMKKIYSLTKKA